MTSEESVPTVNASTIVTKYMGEYGVSVVESKFPSLFDGFKDVNRRIAYVVRNVLEYEKCNKLVGKTMDLHTSGDSSIYNTIVRMGQDFSIGVPLIDIRGNLGSYDDPTAAAARYLNVRASTFLRDLYFNGIHPKTIPMVPTKEFGGLEPKYLIPKIPMALVYGNLTIGFGFKSTIPMYNFGSICELVMRFADHYSSGNLGMIESTRDVIDLLIPDFPIDNYLANRDELVQSYMNGDFTAPICLDGIIDLIGSEILVRTLPYGSSFQSTTQKFIQAAKDKKSWVQDFYTSSDYLKDGFRIGVKQSSDPFEYLDRLKSMLGLRDKFHPLFHYVRDDKVINCTPMTLTFLWYEERYRSVVGTVKYKHSELVQTRNQLVTKLLVGGHTDDVVAIIRNSSSPEECIKGLQQRFPTLTRQQAIYLNGLPINTISRFSENEIKQSISNITADIEKINHDYRRGHEIIHEEANYLRTKYRKTFSRKTRFTSDFIGYVKIGSSGIIHFSSEDEMFEVLAMTGRWNSRYQKTIHLYDRSAHHHYAVKGDRVVPLKESDFSREMSCERIVSYPNMTGDEYTLVVGDRTAACVPGIIPGKTQKGFSLYPITRNFYGIGRDGTVRKMTVDDLSQRKTVSSGSKSDIIFGIPDDRKKVVVFHMNTTDLNVLRINVILRSRSDLGKATFVPTGETRILGIKDMNSDFAIINIPQDCLKNFNMEYLLIRGLSKIFDKNSDYYIQLTKGASNPFGGQFKRHPLIRSMFVLDMKK